MMRIKYHDGNYLLDEDNDLYKVSCIDYAGKFPDGYFRAYYGETCVVELEASNKEVRDILNSLYISGYCDLTTLQFKYSTENMFA